MKLSKLEFKSGLRAIKSPLSSLGLKARLLTWVAGTMVFAIVPVAHAQTVTLESENKSVTITGELVEFNDETYTIRGALGLITVPRNGVLCTGAGCPVIEAEAPEVPAARDVVLASVDDETRITGELIDVEAEHYVIRNALGEFRIAISNVECLGEACPAIEQPKPGITILTAASEYNDVLTDLLGGYAQAHGQRIEVRAAGEGAQGVLVYSNDGELVAEINLEVRNPAEAAQAFSNGVANLLVYGQNSMDELLEASGTAPAVSVNPLAFDGQVVVGHAGNPVRDLSINELNQIWSGDVTSWRPFGGGEFPITLHMVAEGDDTDGWLTGLRASDTPGVVTHASEEEVVAAVEADRNALGIVHWATARKTKSKMIDMRRSCGLTSKPSEFGLRTQHYPFTNAVTSYGPEVGMQEFTKSFLDWTQTAAAAPSVSQHGYLGAQPQRIKLEDMGVAVIHTAAVEPDFDGAEFASMMRELRAADRLSMTFNFISGSTVLDQASVEKVRRLADSMRSNAFPDQELLLVGFADSTGPAANNTALSLRRAEAVRSVLNGEFDEATQAALDVVQLGYGEQMPVDCNTTDTGRENNRRVEVWLRSKG